VSADERTTAGTSVPAIRLSGLTKRFGGTVALNDVSFDVGSSSVHALLGGNGSGKSTLIKILCGVYQADDGDIEIAGAHHSARTTTPDWARTVGIHVVHQGLGIFPELSVADNFALASGYGMPSLAPIPARKLRRHVKEVLARYEVDVSPTDTMGDLPAALQTMVAVARALAGESEPGRGVLILDEPTAALPHGQRDVLLDAVRGYRQRGHTVILVTHRLDEVEAVADHVTFLRDGRHVQTAPITEVDEAAMVRHIAGMERAPVRHAREMVDGEVRLEVRDLHVGPLDGISLQARRGEVVGLSGLLGSGRSALMLALFGQDKPAAGELLLDGRPLVVRDPGDAVRQGIAYVSDDRQHEGQFSDRSVRENLSITNLRRYWRGLAVRRAPEARDARTVIQDYGVVVASEEAPVSTMSGGNQQKVAIARWLELRPRVLLLNEPTQGVDVGARAAIHGLIRAAAEEGMTVIVSSSDARELAELCDRVVGLYLGRVSGEVAGDDLTAERCLELANRDRTATQSTQDSHSTIGVSR
jgi:ribose transport system ATP-binding protein